MTIIKTTPKRVQTEPCFALKTTLKLIQFKGKFTEFLQWLKDNKLVMNNLEPYKEYWDRGLFVYTAKTIKATGTTVCITRVTVKGLYFIKQRLIKETKQVKQTL